MFQKVLISDDFGSINKGVLKVLEQAGVPSIKQVQYCDDEYLHIKSALKDQEPFDLLITDLHFKKDHRAQNYASGEAIIKQLKMEYPQLIIIAYSVEDRLQKVRHLINDLKVNAYVCKGRNGLIDLSKAVDAVYRKEVYVSSQVEQALYPRNDMEIDDYDIQLLKQLALGQSKEAISEQFKKDMISPCSLSSVEKKQRNLFIKFRASNATHLIGIVKDLGLI
jgi:DNA-binding NarL/FixJ family response regulator